MKAFCLLLLLAGAQCGSPPERRLEKVIDDIADLIMAQAGEPKPAMTKSANNFSINFEPGVPKSKRIATGSLVDSTLTIRLFNEVEDETITMENMSAEAELAKVTGYVKEYVAHNKEIRAGAKELRETIKTAINDIKTVDEVEVKAEDAGEALAIELTQGEDKYGLKATLNNKTLKFTANDFEASFTMNMPTVNVIKAQIARLLRELVAHYKDVKKFTNEDKTTVIKTLSCATILGGEGAPFSVFAAQLNADNVEGPTDNVLTVKGVGKLTCADRANANVEYVSLRFVLENDEKPAFSRSLFKESMFDQLPLVSSFFQEIAKVGKQIISPTIPEEAVAEFSPVEGGDAPAGGEGGQSGGEGGEGGGDNGEGRRRMRV